MYRVRPKQVGECRRMYRVRPIFQKDHFGEYSNSTKMANFRRVLKFNKFAVEWPLLTKNAYAMRKWFGKLILQQYCHLYLSVKWQKP
jgi:hypothetical protein